MLPRDLTLVARRQHGLFSHCQAREAGLSRDQLRTRVQTGVLERPALGVYRIAGAPPSWHQAVMAATLGLPGSLASHRSAARLYELDGDWPNEIELLTEHPTWRQRGSLVHRTKDLVSADIAVVAGIPCTSLVRTLVDLPAVINEFRAGDALDHACRRDRSVLTHVLHRHLEVARRGRNGTVALRAMLERRLGEPVVGSGFERRMLNLIARAGLPAPHPQWRVEDGDFVAYLDMAWPDLMIGVECDSLAYHFGETAHQRDRLRRRRLKQLGWDIHEFTYEEVRDSEPLVAAELRRTLTAAQASRSLQPESA